MNIDKLLDLAQSASESQSLSASESAVSVSIDSKENTVMPKSDPAPNSVNLPRVDELGTMQTTNKITLPAVKIFPQQPQSQPHMHHVRQQPVVSLTRDRMRMMEANLQRQKQVEDAHKRRKMGADAERQRREAINKGYQKLSASLPRLMGLEGAETRVKLLHRAADHISMLEQKVRALEEAQHK